MTRPAFDFPTLDAIRANRARLGSRVVTTPLRQLVDDPVAAAVGGDTRVWMKEELFQRTGSFKPRGALSVMLDLDGPALARGVTGVSAGNHGISLGYCTEGFSNGSGNRLAPLRSLPSPIAEGWPSSSRNP